MEINETASANGRWSAVRTRIFWSICFLIRKAYSSRLIDKQIFGPQNVQVPGRVPTVPPAIHFVAYGIIIAPDKKCKLLLLTL